MALFICTSALAPAKRVTFTGETPSATITDEPAVNAVAAMEFGFTLPIGGGESRFAVPLFASTYSLFATSAALLGSGTTGEVENVLTPPTV